MRQEANGVRREAQRNAEQNHERNNNDSRVEWKQTGKVLRNVVGRIIVMIGGDTRVLLFSSRLFQLDKGFLVRIYNGYLILLIRPYQAKVKAKTISRNADFVYDQSRYSVLRLSIRNFIYVCETE